MFSLKTLDEQFNKSREPEFWEMVIFSFWEKGISYQEFSETPLPIIFSIMSTFSFVEDKRAKEMKKRG